MRKAFALFQAIANLFAAELEWNLTANDARQWLRRISGGAAGVGEYELPFPVLFKGDCWLNASTHEEIEVFVAAWRPAN